MSSYHGWTHAPKAAGGTDPIPVDSGLPSAYLYSTPGAVGTGTTFVFTPGTTGLIGKVTDTALFNADITTNGQIEVTETGLYLVRFTGVTDAAHANRTATLELGVSQFGAGGIGGQGSISTATGGGGQYPSFAQGFQILTEIFVNSISVFPSNNYFSGSVGNPVAYNITSVLLMVTRLGDVPTINS